MIAPFLLAAALASAPTVVDLGASAKLYSRADDGALVGLQIVVPAGTVRQTTRQNGLAALTAETILRIPVDGAPLIDRVGTLGGSISAVVAPGNVRFSIEALPAALPGIADAFARALRAPVDADALRAGRDALGERLADDERNPVVVGFEMLRTALYTGPAAVPMLGNTAALAGYRASDVTAFRDAHYRRGGAFAAATGRVDDATARASRTIVDALTAGTEPPVTIAARALPAQPRRVITRRDIGVPFVLVGFPAPALAEPDFAPMLVLRALLEDVGKEQSAVTPTPIERGVTVLYGYDMRPASFAIAINGSRLDASAGIQAVAAILTSAATRPLDPKTLRRFKEKARGEWDLEAVNDVDRAWQIGAAVSEGLDPAVLARVGDAIGAVGTADVRRVAKKYLQRYAVALVLPRAGS